MICPNCHKENPEGDKFCRECGFKLNQPPVTRSVVATDNSQLVRAERVENLVLGGPAAQVEKCPICGKKNPPDKTFTCRVCKRDGLCERHQDPDSFLCLECERQRRAEEQAHLAYEKSVRAEVEAQLRQQLEAELRVEIETRVRRELEPRLRIEIEAQVRHEVEEKVRKEAEEGAHQEAQERVKKEAEEKARQEELERQRKAAEAGKSRSQPGGVRREGEHLWLCLDAETEMEFMRIPAGQFLMGSSEADKEAGSSEKPQHKLHLDEYWLGKYPVTNRQYQSFVLAQKRATPSHWKDGKIPSGKGDRPVVNVSWLDAAALCDWARKLIRQNGGTLLARLPTEAEWEKAARGMDGRLYPWGSQPPDQARCNFNNIVGGSTPVGQYSPQGDSPYGCADMAGNVWEWTSSRFVPYPYKSGDGRENPASLQARVLRGGAFNNNEQSVRCAYRGANAPGYLHRLGFRVCASPT